MKPRHLLFCLLPLLLAACDDHDTRIARRHLEPIIYFDPEAAKFRSVRAHRKIVHTAYCGEVSLKNGFGVYLPYQRFMVILRDPNLVSGNLPEVVNRGVDKGDATFSNYWREYGCDT